MPLQLLRGQPNYDSIYGEWTQTQLPRIPAMQASNSVLHTLLEGNMPRSLYTEKPLPDSILTEMDVHEKLMYVLQYPSKIRQNCYYLNRSKIKPRIYFWLEGDVRYFSPWQDSLLKKNKDTLFAIAYGILSRKTTFYNDLQRLQSIAGNWESPKGWIPLFNWACRTHDNSPEYYTLLNWALFKDTNIRWDKCIRKKHKKYDKMLANGSFTDRYYPFRRKYKKALLHAADAWMKAHP
ncbi:MAG: hypothetical protein JNL57_07025 [Bacteroidetes bacterium]|nr:hypothetical protein [Bacteroidota bacterium]